MRIILVEDEAITVMFLTRALEKLGHQVVGTASQGEQAIELVGAHNPDLVIMDISLAGNMDGITAAEHIRRSFSQPILFASGYNNKDMALRISQIPNSSFCPKPLEIMKLKEMLDFKTNS